MSEKEALLIEHLKRFELKEILEYGKITIQVREGIPTVLAIEKTIKLD